MTARSSLSVKSGQIPLHVPSRRENFNSNASLVLGTDSPTKTRPGLMELFDRSNYKPKSKYENKPKNTLDVLNPKTTSAIKKHSVIRDLETDSLQSFRSN